MATPPSSSSAAGFRRHRLRVSEMLGQAANSRSPGGFYGSCNWTAAGSDLMPEARPETHANGAILTALGDITNKLCSVQSSVSSLSSKVDDLSAKTENLSKRVASMEEEPVKKKRTLQVPHELSTIVRRLYRTFDEEKKFKTSEKIDSDHNYSVADSLTNQITIAGKYSDEHLVSAAVKRYFVSQVRASKTTTPEESKKKRIVARRTKLFERRSKFLKSANERRLWKCVTAAFMSDEETDNEDEGFIIRKPSWRSDLLNKLIMRLDRRYEDKRKDTTSRSKPKEKRKTGNFSTRMHPQGIPKWALQQSPSSPQVCESPAFSQSEPLSSSTPTHTQRPSLQPDVDLSSEDSANEDNDTDEESDGELSTMIRAATMTLYGRDK